MIILTLLVYFACSFDAAEISSVKLNGKMYAIENVINLKETDPLDMVVDFHTGSLYFISAVKDEPGVTLNIIHKGSKYPEKVPGLSSDGQAIAIDQTNGKVYIGTETGLYTYDESTKHATLLATPKHDILYLDVADNGSSIYYYEFDREIVYKLKTDLTALDEFHDISDPYDLTIDKQNNIYFTKIKVPFVLKSGTRDAVPISGLNKDYKLADYNVDYDGQVLAIDKNGNIYKIDPEAAELKMIGSLTLPQEATSIASEKNGDLLVGYENGIIRLKKM